MGSSNVSASKNKLDNLCAIVDYNTLQIDGNVEEVAGLIDIKEKFEKALDLMLLK